MPTNDPADVDARLAEIEHRLQELGADPKADAGEASDLAREREALLTERGEID